MEPPVGVETFELETSILWWEDGILHSKSKPVESTMEGVVEGLRILKEITGGKKVYLLSHIDDTRPSSKEIRDVAGEVMPEICEAIAMVGTKPLARMVINLFFGLKPPSYKTKVFSNVEEARIWLKGLMKE